MVTSSTASDCLNSSLGILLTTKNKEKRKKKRRGERLLHLCINLHIYINFKMN